MRICMDLYPIAPGGAGGAETFSRWIVDIPQHLEKDHEFEVLLHPSQGRRSERIVRGRRFDPFVVPPPPARMSLIRRLYYHPRFPELARRFWRLARRPFGTDRHREDEARRSWLESEGFDVVHCPYPVIDPRPPHHADVPYCINLHDMQHEHFPQYFTGDEIASRRRNYVWSAKVARAIFVVAEHVKADIVHYCEVPPEKIHVVWPGPPFEGMPEVTDERRASVRERYGLPERFFFYPAVTWEHKNHVRLLQAVARVRDGRRYDIPLVFSAQAGAYHRQVLEEVTRLDLERKVKWLGYVPYEDVQALYALADATVVPTLYEATSGPVLEAMSMGCPVACSTVANLPWVVEEGDAGLLFDPLDVDAITDTLERLWEEAELRARLSAAGRRRVGTFSWKLFAEGYLRVYEQVAAKGRP